MAWYDRRRLVLLRAEGENASVGQDTKDGIDSVTYLENLFNMRPVGVTSKKDMGDLNIAVAIRSCNFRDAYTDSGSVRYHRRYGINRVI